MADAYKNFAYTTVATAPSPATSGTSLVVAAGTGGVFPAVPFNAVVWPAGAQPTNTNAEIVRVTGRATDTLTITRAQESSAARSVQVGDQIAAAFTAQLVTDLQAVWAAYTPTLIASITNPTMGTGATLTGRYTQTDKLVVAEANILFGSSGVAAGSGDYYVSVPVAAAAGAVGRVVGCGWVFDASAGTMKLTVAELVSTAAVLMRGENTPTVSAATPWTWATTDQIKLSVTYEAA